MFPGVLFCAAGIETLEFGGAVHQFVLRGKEAEGGFGGDIGRLQLLVAPAKSLCDKELRFSVPAGREVIHRADMFSQEAGDMQVGVDDGGAGVTQLEGEETTP